MSSATPEPDLLCAKFVTSHFLETTPSFGIKSCMPDPISIRNAIWILVRRLVVAVYKLVSRVQGSSNAAREALLVQDASSRDWNAAMFRHMHQSERRLLQYQDPELGIQSLHSISRW